MSVHSNYGVDATCPSCRGRLRLPWTEGGAPEKLAAPPVPAPSSESPAPSPAPAGPEPLPALAPRPHRVLARSSQHAARPGRLRLLLAGGTVGLISIVIVVSGLVTQRRERRMRAHEFGEKLGAQDRELLRVATDVKRQLDAVNAGVADGDALLKSYDALKSRIDATCVAVESMSVPDTPHARELHRLFLDACQFSRRVVDQEIRVVVRYVAGLDDDERAFLAAIRRLQKDIAPEEQRRMDAARAALWKFCLEEGFTLSSR